MSFPTHFGLDPSPKKIPVSEFFGPTIQGEGAVIGLQTYFVRFGLCDYKCTKCDSLNAVDPKYVRANAKFLTQFEIFRMICDGWKQGSTPWITYTGGNPCIHDLTLLTTALKDVDFKITLETQGTILPKWVEYCDQITVSPKGPGMGEEVNWSMMDEWLDNYGSSDRFSLKFPIFDRRDLELVIYAAERYERFKRFGLYDRIYLSLGNDMPADVDGHADISHADLMMRLVQNYKILWEEIQSDPILSQFKFLPQWHTFVWGNEKGK